MTIYFIMVAVSFVCMFYGLRKYQGYLTIGDLLACVAVSALPMFNLVFAFLALNDAGILSKKIL